MSRPAALVPLAVAVAVSLGAGERPAPRGPYLVVLGVAQDGGVPQAGTKEHPGWEDAAHRRLVTSLGLVDPRSGRRWLFEATPDFPAQLHRLDRLAPVAETPGLAGVFLTHAHMGHYLGLAHLGREAIGARGVPVHVMPRMERFLKTNGPWSLLVEGGNVELRPLAAGRPVALAPDLAVTPIPVPHRDEYSETVAFRVDGPRRSVLFLPDIDKWERWETPLADVLATVDVAYLDGTFHADGEVPGRDMASIRHPFIVETLALVAPLPAAERAKVRFIHLNRTNPALDPTSAAARAVAAAGCAVAQEMERQEL